MNQQKIIQTIKMVLAVAVLTIGTTYVLAADWTAPTVPPPGCPSGKPGCEVPLNVSIADQFKSGGLGLGGFFSTRGKTVIGHGTAAPTIVESLKLKVDGKVGAEAYCDRDGNNCATPPFGAGGGSSFWRQAGTSDRIENTNPGRVDILGKIKIIGGEPGRNKILASNAEGVANWKSLAELGAVEGFTAECDPGEAIRSINLSTGAVLCSTIPNGGNGGGGLFQLIFNVVGGGTGSGGSSYQTSCSSDARDATCRRGYTRVSVANCGTEMVNNTPTPKTYAICEPNNQ
ncbi:MAG: hypothetical protein KBC48_02845 [Candidatus Pacebacteria bacterium]|nr:hypothetical protein [Candidatus Paceibacterota bacterium]